LRLEKNFWWKRKCETVRCRDATASSSVVKIRGEVYAHFQAYNVTEVLGIDCAACQDELFVNNHLDVIIKWWACSWFCFYTCLALLGLPWTKTAIQAPVYVSCFLPLTLVQSLPRSQWHFLRDLHTIWFYSLVGSIAKSHQARYTTPK
jgi:hypothetical protein